jgi:hypothetical protein
LLILKAGACALLKIPAIQKNYGHPGLTSYSQLSRRILEHRSNSPCILSIQNPTHLCYDYAMSSLRSRLVHAGIRFSKLLGEDTTLDNLEQKRANYNRLHRFFPVSKSAKIRAFQGEGFKGEWIEAPNSHADRIVLYFHGGGFVFGNPKVHRDLI